MDDDLTRSLVAACLVLTGAACVVTGVLVLAGLGWGLVAAGVAGLALGYWLLP